MEPGDRVKVKLEHWTGIGSRSGTLVSAGPHRSLVRFDDGTLVDIDTGAIEAA